MKLKVSPDGRYRIWERYLKGSGRKWKIHRPKRDAKGYTFNDAQRLRNLLRKSNRIDTWGFRVEPMGYDPNKEK